MRVLFVENDDSYSWNVVDCLAMAGADVCVRPRAAALDGDALAGVQAVVIGPGPTDPVRAGLVKLVHAVAARSLPLLGICLGHQALGVAFGAKVVRVTPMHGKQSAVSFTASRLFGGCEGRHTVMRYHSLALAEVQPPLRITARTEDGTVMAIEHDSLPLAGLQFHPDSFATPDGPEMVAAFFRAAL